MVRLYTSLYWNTLTNAMSNKIGTSVPIFLQHKNPYQLARMFMIGADDGERRLLRTAWDSRCLSCVQGHVAQTV